MTELPEKCCGRCRHATKKGLSKHYQRWLVICTIAEKHVARAVKEFKKIRGLPECVMAPQQMDMCDTTQGTTCPCFEAKEKPE